MKKQSVLYVEFLTNTAANHLLMMIKGIVKRKNITCVCLCQKDSFLAQELKKLQNVHVYEIFYGVVNPQNKLAVILRNLIYLCTLFYIIRKHKITLIHSHRLAWTYVAILPAFLFNIPLLVQVVVLEKPKNSIKRFIIQHYPGINFLAVSKNSKEQFQQTFSLPANRIDYHYGGIYYPDIKTNMNTSVPELEKVIKQKKIIIGMISRIDNLKGVDVFIEAAGILAKQNPLLYFVHVGNQSGTNDLYLKFCKDRITSLKITDRFIFMNYKNNILPYYKYFYLTVLPTYKDTLAYVNIESGAYGVPVIATNTAGVPETVADSRCLIPFPPLPKVLANKIQYFIDHTNEYGLVKSKVKHFILERFDAEKNAKILLKKYQSMQ